MVKWNGCVKSGERLGGKKEKYMSQVIKYGQKNKLKKYWWKTIEMNECK